MGPHHAGTASTRTASGKPSSSASSPSSSPLSLTTSTPASPQSSSMTGTTSTRIFWTQSTRVFAQSGLPQTLSPKQQPPTGAITFLAFATLSSLSGASLLPLTVSAVGAE